MRWLSVAAKLPGKSALAVALAIMFEAGRRRRTQDIILTTAILQRFGVNRKAKYRAVKKLEGANLITVVRRPNKNPIISVLTLEDGERATSDGQGVPVTSPDGRSDL